jgi:hypothetical protein
MLMYGEMVSRKKQKSSDHSSRKSNSTVEPTPGRSLARRPSRLALLNRASLFFGTWAPAPAHRVMLGRSRENTREHATDGGQA